jgi:hypothetical protein
MYGQFRIGPTGGVIFSHQNQKSNTYNFEGVYTSRISFIAGASMDIRIRKNFNFQPEVLYSLKGGTYTNLKEESKVNLGYLVVPMVLSYKLDLNKAYMVFGAGPYVSKLVINNHSYIQNGKDVESGKLRVGTNYDTDQIKPWDAGFKFKLGFEHKKGLFFNAFYDLGTADVNPQFTITHNKAIGVQIGYLFSVTEEDRYERFNEFYDF